MKPKFLTGCTIWILFVFPALAQGTLAQIAAGGGWQTTITLLNLGTSAAAARVSLYSDSGAPLVLPAMGQATSSQYTLSIPANGSTSLVLTNTGTSSAGWANIESVDGAPIRGQGTFVYQPLSWSGAVPLTPAASSSNACIVPLPPPTTSTILVPFDETGSSIVGLAIANVSGSSQAVSVEADDANDSVLLTDTLNMASMTHQSFTLNDRYPALQNHQGILRITAASQSLSVLAFAATGNGGFSTVLPIYP